MRHGLTALVGVLTLAGGLLLAAPSLALAPPGEVEEFKLAKIEENLLGGIAVGAEGNIWFTEETSSPGCYGAGEFGEIGLITTKGEFSDYPVPATGTGPASTEEPATSCPSSIARGPNGTMWFVDTGYNSEGLQLIGRIEVEGAKIKEFPVPAGNYLYGGITEGPDHNMWFVTSDAIGRIPPSGSPIMTWPLPQGVSSSTMPEYTDPVGIAAGPGGYMWFTEGGVNDERKPYIGRIGTGLDGTHQGKIEEFQIPTKYAFPTGIVEGPNGNMWFIEDGADLVGQITPAGEILKEEIHIGNASYSSTGIAVGPDHNLWFTETTGDSIGRITMSGEVKTFPLAIKSSEPTGIVSGPDGNMWFVEQDATEVSPIPGSFYHIGRFTIPYAPAGIPSSPPTISGATTAGQVLTASTGSWTNTPRSFTYQWQVCEASGNNCSNINGETGVSHPLGAGEVGHTLRVLVTAANVAGSATATSAPSAVVAPAPPPPPPPPVTPHVEAAMTWTFGAAKKFTLVQSLLVHAVPKGAKVEVVCQGRGCPFSRHTSATVASHRPSHHSSCHGRKCKKARPRPQGPEVSLTGLFKGRHLGIGTKISVRIVKSGWIGKVYVFTTRSNKQPSAQISCLAPGSTVPGKGC